MEELLPSEVLRGRPASIPRSQTERNTRHNSPTSCEDSMTIIQSRKTSCDEAMNGKPRVSSCLNTKRPTYNDRKDSCTSIREDFETPQSFRSRRFSVQPLENESEEDEDDRQQSWEFIDERYDEIQDAAVDNSNVSCITTPDSGFDSTKKPLTVEDLPDEILDNIYRLIQIDNTQQDSLSYRVDLVSCLLVSKRMQAAALRVLYRHVTIYRSKMFRKFAAAVSQDHKLGSLVQYLDFSHYSQLGYGRSRGETNATPWLTSETLKTVLRHTTQLKVFLVHEHIDDELNREVLTSLFSIPTLQAVDFAACNSQPFVDSFTTTCLNGYLPSSPLPLKRLSMHECGTLKPGVFRALLPRLQQLTHLDVAHTLITDEALFSIPNTAKITHLNLARCNRITGSGVTEFLLKHPAVQNSLVWLDISADASRYRLLDEQELSSILDHLPSSLRSLNIGGAKITLNHTQSLRRLAVHLEELGLKGAELGLAADIARILHLKSTDDPIFHDGEVTPSQLRYIDLTDIRSVTQMSLLYSPLKILDSHSFPLEVIELGSTVLTEIQRRDKNTPAHLKEWTVKELGRRGWYVRNSAYLPTDTEADDGYRPWKMGARWWGARKIPMLEQEVGGMYGYFMFKKS